MSKWFDDAAKRAARDDVANESNSGITRRTALKRGAVVAGVAWTAPMLMQTAAVANTVASCAAGSICGSGTGRVCCDGQQTGCVAANGTNGQGTCVAKVGETCTTAPGTACGGGSNQSFCGTDGICGGTGAKCGGTNGGVCFTPTHTCSVSNTTGSTTGTCS